MHFTVFWIKGGVLCGAPKKEENRMTLKINVCEMTEECEDKEATGFLGGAILDMFFQETSNCYSIDMLLGWSDSYLLSCTDESGAVCGVFAVHITHAVNGADCYVNIAYTREDSRRRGVFGMLFEYTKNALPGIAGIDYDTISFGVFDRNVTMGCVMKQSGCLPVEHIADMEATIYTFPRNVSAVPQVRAQTCSQGNGEEAVRLSA